MLRITSAAVSSRSVFAAAALTIIVVFALTTSQSSAQAAWPQWGQNPQHTGYLSVPGQSLQAKLSDQIFDPFTAQEMAESNGALLMHYQVPLVNGNNVYMMFKTGTYDSCVPPGSGNPFPCGPNDWNTEIWNETDLQWQNGQLVPVWNFATDWTPVPNDYTLGGWEPLFQPVLAQTYIYVPGAGGTIYQLDQLTGAVLQQINPFGTTEDPTKFVSGGLTADNQGNIYYNVMQVVLAWPWDSDIVNSWIVKVATNGTITTVTYPSLLPNAPTTCLGTFAHLAQEFHSRGIAAFVRRCADVAARPASGTPPLAARLAEVETVSQAAQRFQHLFVSSVCFAQRVYNPAPLAGDRRDPIRTGVHSACIFEDGLPRAAGPWCRPGAPAPQRHERDPGCEHTALAAG